MNKTKENQPGCLEFMFRSLMKKDHYSHYFKI